ncbi:uncharacterized protein LOC118482599 [Helianthus annuus]|uniref:uncharacterized protein LOC118482599 n=1 Tax=Helianthus annuus TaxID=4232 RepID=UPI001652D3FE|nr:uncharacterized protein LOC118482599 [Helianthus annuus]
MGKKAVISPLEDPDSLFVNKLDTNMALAMVSNFSKEEVKEAMFQINDEKAPGPDGYSAKFFKEAWDIVGNEVTEAVLDFFRNGRLLKELNATVLSMVPKVKAPNSVAEFRPIACCNVLYKCISKVLCNRLKGCLDKLVSQNQSAFIPGRLISDNILLSQELVKGYDWKGGCPRVAVKIDLQKAYDSVNHEFIKNSLFHFGFHGKFVEWVMCCLDSVSYSVALNGNLYGFFRGEKGLRQGDPMSPYLFTIVMEVLNLIIKRKIRENDKFKFHWRCERVGLTHLCFADDLLIFCGPDMESFGIIKGAVDEFSRVSGLVPNVHKSEIFFGNVNEELRKEILNVLPFKVGQFPMKYLGIPLSSKRLYQADCKVLIDKVKNRISDWKVKFLSFAGKVQLIKSVLSSLTIYWSSLFILPINVAEDIERLMRGFLWNHHDGSRGLARVKWDEVCRPKLYGGLNILSLRKQNMALMTKHIWNLLSNKDSLWVKWIKSYKLMGRSFWEIGENRLDSWSWGHLLQNRNMVRNNFIVKIGNGMDSFAWHDLWHEKGILGNLIDRRDIREAGFDQKTKVAELFNSQGWQVPEEWHRKYPWLVQRSVETFHIDKKDCVEWKGSDGKVVRFSVKQVYNSFSCAGEVVKWSSFVWFSQCIPKHAFINWLAFRGKLLTQDRMLSWGWDGDLSCVFCKRCPDSHDHLFFSCEYSSAVWRRVRRQARMEEAPCLWQEFIVFAEKMKKGKSIWDIIRRLVVAACVYFIWLERNGRLFRDNSRSPQQLFVRICEEVRMRLVGLKLKRSSNVLEAAEVWRFKGALTIQVISAFCEWGLGFSVLWEGTNQGGNLNRVFVLVASLEGVSTILVTSAVVDGRLGDLMLWGCICPGVIRKEIITVYRTLFSTYNSFWICLEPYSDNQSRSIWSGCFFLKPFLVLVLNPLSLLVWGGVCWLCIGLGLCAGNGEWLMRGNGVKNKLFNSGCNWENCCDRSLGLWESLGDKRVIGLGRGGLE